MENMRELIQGLSALEKISRTLDSAQPKRQVLNESVIQYADDFLKALPKRKAFEIEKLEGEDFSCFYLQEAPIHIKDLLTIYDDKLMHSGINPASGGHLGYIPGGGIYESALGDYLAAVTNKYAGVFYASPGAVRIENSLVRWVGELIGYTGNFGGSLLAGGSMANFSAIITARQVMKIKGAELHKSVIYLSEQVHHCVPKAIRMAGMDECIIRKIPLDDQYRLIPEIFENQIKADFKAGLKPFLLTASAGTTDVGAIDPLDALGDICKKYGVWFHVDAAYGGFFVLTTEGKLKLKGMEKADSVILDPHKGLFLPYGLGMVLTKNVAHLKETFSFEANYMQDTYAFNLEYSPADVSPELSKHFRGLRMWFPLKLHGIAPFRAALEEKLLLCKYFYHQLKLLGFETGPYPELSVMLYRFVPDNADANNFNKELLSKIHNNGKIFISSTLIKGVFWLRIAILSFRTHRKEVDELLSQLKQATAR
jgi:aromatic-L-amino-acid decarboxylase